MVTLYMAAMLCSPTELPMTSSQEIEELMMIEDEVRRLKVVLAEMEEAFDELNSRMGNELGEIEMRLGRFEPSVESTVNRTPQHSSPWW